MYSQTGLSVRGLHTGPVDRVPTTEGISGQNTLSTGPVKGTVRCWNLHHTLWCTNIYQTLQGDRRRSNNSKITLRYICGKQSLALVQWYKIRKSVRWFTWMSLFICHKCQVYQRITSIHSAACFQWDINYTEPRSLLSIWPCLGPIGVSILSILFFPCLEWYGALHQKNQLLRSLHEGVNRQTLTRYFSSLSPAGLNSPSCGETELLLPAMAKTTIFHFNHFIDMVRHNDVEFLRIPKSYKEMFRFLQGWITHLLSKSNSGPLC